jgi:hypothetical protein
MSDTIRAAYIGAAVTMAAPVVGFGLARMDPATPAPSPPPIVRVVEGGGSAAPIGVVCVKLERAVLSFAERHPDAAQLYARRGDSDLPALATPEERALCGDPERLLEQLPAPAP